MSYKDFCHEKKTFKKRFQKNHPVLEKFLSKMQYTFNGKSWNANGPVLVTNVMKEFCKVQNISQMNSENCQGVHIFHSNVFYPIPWRNWKILFEEDGSKSDLKIIHPNVSSIHLWGRFSGAISLEKAHVNFFYILWQKKNCPLSMSLKDYCL